MQWNDFEQHLQANTFFDAVDDALRRAMGYPPEPTAWTDSLGLLPLIRTDALQHWLTTSPAIAKVRAKGSSQIEPVLSLLLERHLLHLGTRVDPTGFLDFWHNLTQSHPAANDLHTLWSSDRLTSTLDSQLSPQDQETRFGTLLHATAQPLRNVAGLDWAHRTLERLALRRPTASRSSHRPRRLRLATPHLVDPPARRPRSSSRSAQRIPTPTFRPNTSSATTSSTPLRQLAQTIGPNTFRHLTHTTRPSRRKSPRRLQRHHGDLARPMAHAGGPIRRGPPLDAPTVGARHSHPRSHRHSHRRLRWPRRTLGRESRTPRRRGHSRDARQRADSHRSDRRFPLLLHPQSLSSPSRAGPRWCR